MLFLFASRNFSPKILEIEFLENRGFSVAGVEKRRVL
jgi:hypothetical protein